MDELTPRSRALLARARAAREPTPDDKARIQSRLFAAVAAGAGAAAAAAAGGAAGGAASSGGGAAAGAASSGGGTTGGAASGGGSIGGAAASKGMVGGSVAGTTSAAGSVLSAGAGAAAVGAGATAAAGGGGWVAGVVVALTIGGLAAGGVGLHLAQSDDPEAETQRGDLASPIGARDEEPVNGTATERRGGDDGALPVSRDGRGPGSGGAGGTAERAPARPASESRPPALGVDPLAPGPTSDRSGAGGVDDLDAARDEDATIGEREHGRGGASSSGAAQGFRGHIGAPTKARRSGPAGARSAPPREAAHSDLAAQVALLRDADAELQAGQAVRALALLRVHAHRFPDSQLWAERDATRILALCALGRADEARRRARDWMARAGASPLRASIRSSCAYR